MNTQAIVTALDDEIRRLRQVRELLAEQKPAARRGRPKGSTNKPPSVATSFDPTQFEARKQSTTPEGKTRVAAAKRTRRSKQNAAPAPAFLASAAAVSKSATSKSTAKKVLPARSAASKAAAPKKAVKAAAKTSASKKALASERKPDRSSREGSAAPSARPAAEQASQATG